MSAIAPARRCAYTVLRRVFEDGAYADRVFHIQANELDPRDRALAMRLSYGATQRNGTLEFFIERLAERSLDRLDPAALAALRLGLYELLYLGGAPDHAIVADAVELAKRHRSGGFGLVNAVLRRAVRERETLLGGLGEGTPQRAAILHSHPPWLAEMWWSELGAHETCLLMAEDNEPAEVAVRVNSLVSDPTTVASQLTVGTHFDEHLPEALVLDGPFDLQGSDLWAAGALTAQSRGAMLVARAVDPQPQELVLDLCAAPGGKSAHLAALMGATGNVVAVESHQRRAQALTDTVQRLHATNVHVELGDATLPRPEGAVFDRVLVDPPCSGLGVLQARADLRWRTGPQAISELVSLQARILGAALAAVRPGGVLVYSTCTISQAENEHQIAALTDAHPELSVDGLAQTLPHRDRTAGFFIARLRKSA